MDKLRLLFAKVLKVNYEEISEETSSRNIVQWDSLVSMALIARLEDDFEVEFTIDEIRQINSVAAARKILIDKGFIDRLKEE